VCFWVTCFCRVPTLLVENRASARVLPWPCVGIAHIDEDHRPQYSHEEGQRKPAQGLEIDVLEHTKHDLAV